MGLAVIGAGFGRTGTESMKVALEMLGLGPCYHMKEVLPHSERIAVWRKAARGELPDWDGVFAGYASTLDWPAAYFWRELSAFYPGAKIILTVRDANDWYASMDKTIFSGLRQSTDPDSIGLRLIGKAVFGGNYDRSHAIAVYERHIAEVEAAVPDERLLTFRTGDGWVPLCRFLGKPVPDEPYPHRNRPAEFHQTMEEFGRGDRD